MVPCTKIIASSLTSSDTDGKNDEIEYKLNHVGQSVWPIKSFSSVYKKLEIGDSNHQYAIT